MRVNLIMTPDPACCTPDTTAKDAAILMKQYDCGAIPVVGNGSIAAARGTPTASEAARVTRAKGRRNRDERVILGQIGSGAGIL